MPGSAEQARRARGERLPEHDRFWAFVNKTPGCWLWTGHTVGRPDSLRYGGFKAWAGGRWKEVRAHRHAWEMHFGPIPDGLNVCHSCDEPLCIRPDHLFLGTHADNIRDRDAKGRGGSACGEDNARSKLTERQAREILAHASDGRTTQEQIAAFYGITQAQVSRIKTGKAWA